MAHGTVIAHGENILALYLKRTAKGLLVKAKAHPVIEETFQAWSGTGGQSLANTHGRYWSHPKDLPLQVWSLAEVIPPGRVDGATYRVDRVGTLILEGEPNVLDRGEDRPRPQSSMIVNLGFLRLVGISSPEGVEFIVRGVFSTEGVQEINRFVMAATKCLVLDYMRAVDLHFVLASEGR